MSLPDLDLWQEYVARRCGMTFPETRQRVLARCLDDRVKAGGYRDRTDYYHAVTAPSGDGEWRTLFEHLLNGETRFFRDAPAFTVFRDRLLPQLRAAHPDRPIRLWSAGCSTGAEAYSLAMLAADADVPMDVLATDIHPAALAKAAAGRYKRFELAGLSDGHRLRYVVPTDTDEATIAPTIRGRVTVRRLDLTSEDDYSVPTQDVIVCQNVLIYYTPAAAAAIIRRLIAALADDGFLILGAIEAVGLQVPELERVPVDAAIFRRPQTRTNPEADFS